jgi:hypothetical protein
MILSLVGIFLSVTLLTVGVFFVIYKRINSPERQITKSVE